MAERSTFEIKEGVTVSDEVVSIVAGLAATEVDGVDCLHGNIKNNMVAKSGNGKLSKAVRIIRNDDETISVKLGLVIKFGYEIPATCGKVQDKVQTAIQNMTGIEVKEVDIKITTVTMD